MSSPIPMPVGISSLSAEQTQAHRVLTELLLDRLRRNGYQVTEVPAFDDLEVFERLYGREIRQRLLSFTTDREYALRPDLTVSLCRELTQRLDAGAIAGPVRLAAAGPAWRHERVRPLRQRQFVQIGIERIGDAPTHTASADVEILRLAVSILDHEGIAPAALRIGHAGLRAHLLDGLACTEPIRRALDVLLDLTSRVRDRFDPPCGQGVWFDPGDGQRRRVAPHSHEDADHIREVAVRVANRYVETPIPEDTPLRALLWRLEERLVETATLANLTPGFAAALLALTHSTPSLAELTELAAPLLPGATELVAQGLGHMMEVDLPVGISRRFSLAFSRSIGYYTGIIFELDAPVLGPDAGQIVGGGRYDDVLEQLGSAPLTAAGFAIGLERLLAALEAIHGPAALQRRFALGPALWLCRTSAVKPGDAQGVAESFRRRGIAVATDPSPLALPLEASVVPRRAGHQTVVVTEQGLCLLDAAQSRLRPTDLASVAALLGPGLEP